MNLNNTVRLLIILLIGFLTPSMFVFAQTIFVTNGSAQIGTFPSSLPNTSFRIDTTATNTASVTTISSNFVGSSTATLSPTTGWTQVVSSNFDDANIQISWATTTFNNVNYTSIFVGSNTYITFGSGSNLYASLSASNPALPGVHMCASDNSYQKVFHKLDSAGVRRVRYEGNNSTSGTVGSPTIVYEAVFYEGLKYFDLYMGSNSRCPADSAPTITSISSTKANGSYKAGEVIPINVTFSEIVTSTGNVTVTLETGATDRTCIFTVTSATTGTCNYTVQAGDTTADLNVNSVSGTIRDVGLNSMSNFTPATTLATNKNIVIDTTAPTVTGVTSSLANGSYRSGQVIPIQVVFSENVTVSGSPRLVLVTGSPAVTNLGYSSGSGTATLVFNYTVGNNNYSSDLDYGSTGALSLNNGTILDAAGNNATLTLAAPGAAGSIGANKAIVINNRALTVAITSIAPSLTNTAIPVSVTFSESVTNFVVGDISVSNGTAGSFTGSGATYTFSVTPTANGSVSISIPVSIATDTAGNNNSASNTITRTFDNIVPTVAITTLASSPTAQTPIAYTATFSEAVTGFALADISVTNAVLGNFNAVSSTVYTFDVSPIGHRTPIHDVNVTVSIPSSSAIDAAGNNNSASDSGVPAAIAFDNHNPTVSLTSAVADPASSGTIAVNVSFSEGVTDFVVGDLSLTNATVTNFTVSSSTVYTFNLIPSGEGTASVFVPAGVSQDSASNLNLISNTLSRLYDATPPTVALTSSASATTSSSVINVTATFSEIVTGFVVGDLSLTNSTVTNFAGTGTTYTFDLIPSSQGTVSVFVPANISVDGASNNNLISNTLSRVYDTVGPVISEVTAVAASLSDTTPDYVFTSNEVGTITYGGACSSVNTSASVGNNTVTFATLSEGSYNDCNITVTDSVSNISNVLVLTNFVIDTTAPTITNVSSDKDNGSYKAGEIIDINITFSEVVTSTGNVTVTLETGATDRTCTFTVTGATTGTCNYTVQAGDTTADLTVNTISGTIADAASNAMTNFVPTTNLAANKAIVIDTTAPTITNVSSDKVNGSYTVGEVIDIDITFSEVVTSTGNVTVTLETGATDRTCTFTVTSATTGTCNYTVQAGDTTADLTVNTISGTIADAVSNAMTNFVPTTNLAANKAIVIDTIAPTVSVTAPITIEVVSGSEFVLKANASDVDSSVVGVKFYINGTLQGSEDTSSPYTTSWDSTATTTGAYSVFAVARDAATNYATSTAVAFNVSNTGPTQTSVTTTSTITTATVVWTTSVLASSRMFFGPSTAFGSSTPETDTSPRVTSHSVGLTGLPACTLYYYEVVSRNAVLDIATSSVATFTTTGCTGEASVLATGVGSITTASGGTLTQGVLTLTVPTSFTATSSSATFQAKLLDATTFFASAGAPSSKTRAGDTAFNLKALYDTSTTLATFSAPLTVTLAYTASDISGLNESSLLIYRYDGASWYTLSGCSTNTSAKTVTCTTTAFSDFAIFGTATVAVATTTSGGGTMIWCSGPMAQGWNVKLHDGGCGNTKISTDNQSLTVIPVASSTIPINKFLFKNNLKIGSTGSEVRELQRYLNNQGFVLAAKGAGSMGQETEHFGTLTHVALIKFQNVYRVEILLPIALKNGSGIFGPSTRAFVNKTNNSVLPTAVPASSPVSASAESVTPPQTSVTKPYLFTRTLRTGSEGEDVIELQKFLNSQGFVLAVRGSGSAGNETNYFGPIAWNALVKFQEAHTEELLKPSGLQKGTGIFGDLTRDLVNKINTSFR